MKIRLSGYNVPIENLSDREIGDDSISPEIFSAAYARISRSPLSISRLRQEAFRDLKKARKSNQKIIFAMGHHSVAEHAVFNFDVEEISRLALEEIERFRLNSYTEKSQRYVRLQDDFYLPAEFSVRHRELFLEEVARQNSFYQKAVDAIQSHLSKLTPSPGNIEEMSKEDGRFALSLATFGQVGLTINARNLEHLLRRLSQSPLAEVRLLAAGFYENAFKIAPSLILFDSPSAFDRKIFENAPLIKFLAGKNNSRSRLSGNSFRLLEVSDHPDARIAAAFLFPRSGSFAPGNFSAPLPAKRELKSFYLELFREMEFFDRPPREFEFAELSFEATVSASCFAQLKRHRMISLLSSPYIADLRPVTPGNFIPAGVAQDFRDLLKSSSRVYRLLEKSYGPSASYILTNAHKRRVLVKMNFRELYHFARLRADDHAQWEIRDLANSLIGAVKRRAPLATLLLCGKSDFARQFEKIYRRPPSRLVP